MLLVVDANVLFAAMIKEGDTAEVLVSEQLRLITPEFVLSEFEKHKDEILLKTHRTSVDFAKFLYILENRIEVIPSTEIKPFLRDAESIIHVHPKDVPYFALALKYDCAIWSNEKRLKEHQKRIKVYNTAELLSQLTRKNSAT